MGSSAVKDEKIKQPPKYGKLPPLPLNILN